MAVALITLYTGPTMAAGGLAQAAATPLLSVLAKVQYPVTFSEYLVLKVLAKIVQCIDRTYLDTDIHPGLLVIAVRGWYSLSEQALMRPDAGSVFYARSNSNPTAAVVVHQGGGDLFLLATSMHV